MGKGILHIHIGSVDTFSSQQLVLLIVKRVRTLPARFVLLLLNVWPGFFIIETIQITRALHK